MTPTVRSFRILIDSMYDIGTAVRASREYSRLSSPAVESRVDRPFESALLPL